MAYKIPYCITAVSLLQFGIFFTTLFPRFCIVLPVFHSPFLNFNIAYLPFLILILFFLLFEAGSSCTVLILLKLTDLVGSSAFSFRFPSSWACGTILGHPLSLKEDYFTLEVLPHCYARWWQWEQQNRRQLPICACSCLDTVADACFPASLWLNGYLSHELSQVYCIRLIFLAYLFLSQICGLINNSPGMEKDWLFKNQKLYNTSILDSLSS